MNLSLMSTQSQTCFSTIHCPKHLHQEPQTQKIKDQRKLKKKPGVNVPDVVKKVELVFSIIPQGKMIGSKFVVREENYF